MTDWTSLLEEFGAVFNDAGLPGALHFGDPTAEYAAGRNGTVVFDMSDRTQIELTGGDRATFLNNFCTNDVVSLSPGEGCEAFITSIKGRVLGHIFVFVEEETIWIDTVPGGEDALIAHLDRYLITEDVELHPRSKEFAELFVSGPESLAALRLAGLVFELSKAIAHCRSELPDGEELSVRRVDWFGTPGLLLAMARERISAVWKSLTATGTIQPAGSVAFETLRIESRFPLYGRDITEENLAQEVARTERAISFKKGCYLGQEPIARIDAMGHVNRELRGLTLERGPCPEPGSRILAPDDAKEVGQITSAVQLSEDRAPVALGYVRSRFAAPESTVLVETGDGPIPARVFE